MKLIFKNKWYYLGTCSALVVVSFLITLCVYILNAGSIYTTILFCLAILMFGISFLKKHYARLAGYIRSFLDRETLNSTQIRSFRWAFISNIVIWIALFTFLSFFERVDVSKEIEFLTMGTTCIIWLILALGISYYTATRRFVIDFRPEIKRKNKVRFSNISEDNNVEMAKSYTKLVLSPYIKSDEIIKELCSSVEKLIKGDEVSYITHISLESVRAGDIRRYGWNISKHFMNCKESQKVVSHFLKQQFSIFEKWEVGVIQNRLKSSNDKRQNIRIVEEKKEMVNLLNNVKKQGES